ncbi:MAG: RuBisCO large subunit C-terminal-like domain-containing protein [Desulfitobacteriaceae bacterium]
MRIKVDNELLRPLISGERFSVVYRIMGDETSALGIAQDICLEQTVEFPEECVPEGVIRDSIIGRIEKIKKLDENEKLEKNEKSLRGKLLEEIGLLGKIERNTSSSVQVEISYAVETCASEFTQLLNVIFGNISIKPGIRVEKILLSPSLLRLFRGPRFGIIGLRQILQVPHIPLLFTALKPLGLSASELARLAYQFAVGGIDIIKDDHGLSDQAFAPFTERVKLCTEAVQQANRETGRRTIYVPNVTGPTKSLMSRAKMAKEIGAGGLLVTPGLVGFDAMKELAEDDSIALPIFSHPAFQGSYVLGDSGISHYAMYGQLMRMAGADATIYPNFGGRFSFCQAECHQIVEGTGVEMGHLKPIFPSPGGGINIKSIPTLAKFYGNDVIFLMGGGLFTSGPDIVENCRHFRELVEETFATEVNME